MKILGLGLLVLLLCPASQAQKQKSDPSWDSWKFLIGEWEGEGGGGPGQGTGGFSFKTELQGAVLVRQNYSEYPAAKDHPASRHEDYMILYREPGSEKLRAFYVDSEGHAINYSAAVSADGKSFTFASDPLASAPRYRLTYVQTGDDRLKILFEIAPPGAPEKFAKYIEATAHKAPSSK